MVTTKSIAADLADLDERFAGWRAALAALAPMGVADSVHLQAAAGWRRDQVDRLLAALAKRVAAGEAPLLSQVTERIVRLGHSGRARKIFLLESAGAAVLRASGVADAEACQLSDPTVIGHALAVIDVRQAALQAQLSVATDRVLRGSFGCTLRPDNLVTLADGTRLLVESEQVATSHLLPRLVDSLRRKLKFWQAGAPQDLPPVVRILLTTAPGDFARSLSLWQSALLAVAEEHGAPLPCRFAVQALDDFLQAPDWGEPLDSERWHMLRDQSDPRPGAGQRKGAGAVALTAPEDFTGRQVSLVLRAIRHTLEVQAATSEGDRALPAPDAALFDIAMLIYMASHGPGRTVLAQAGIPWASIAMLRHFLRLRPRLLAALTAEIRRADRAGAHPQAVLHRMLLIAEVFLRHFGFGVDGPLHVWAATAGYGDPDTRPYYIGVQIRRGALLRDPITGLSPAPRELEVTLEALRWLLNALFIYAGDVGLPRPAFW